MPENLPSTESIDLLLARIDALIGLSAKFPPRRGEIRVENPRDRDRYATLWQDVDAGLAAVRCAGFPIANPNLHEDIESMWAWCVSFGEKLGLESRIKPRRLYQDTIETLQHLKEIVSHADSPLEARRELRESALRTNELFVIMAFRPETVSFQTNIAAPAALACGLSPVIIKDKEPEEAISEALLSSIRRSILVLCDLSFERPNCYFEAGFAKGAMRRVLFSCRRDHNLRSTPTSKYRVHFDVDQFKITWWDDTHLESAKSELEGRLRVLLAEIRNQ